jgi:CRP/FNR family transcriptional regulator
MSQENQLFSLFLSQRKFVEPELIAALKQHSCVKRHDKDVLLLESGEYITALTILLAGKMRVYQENNEKEILLYHLQPFETCPLSLSSCIELCQSEANIVTSEESIILSIPAHLAKEWKDKYTSWRDYMFEVYKQQYTSLLGNYANLAFLTLEERLLNYLKQQQRNHIVNESHQEIANQLAASRVAISRLLKRFQHRGIIEMKSKEITMLV